MYTNIKSEWGLLYEYSLSTNILNDYIIKRFCYLRAINKNLVKYLIINNLEIKFIHDNANKTQHYNTPYIMDHGLIYMENSLLSIEKENEVLAHRFHMDIFQKRKLEVADEIVSSTFILHNPVLPSEIKNGIEGVKRFAMATIDAMPDRQFTHEDAIANGNKVLIRWKLTGKIVRDIWISA